ncbi:DUF2461 domain-containing protein [Pararhodobacter zhoushanensis]|uniref:DUF2461 domain-containing protein n=1 Tax=Pararhodobacter zhoushanensis TaxID=2479545 RepID=UPI000F8DE068|nr:DUF2461 domain-containing protein [Pararhodobacter zhoushanensis]
MFDAETLTFLTDLRANNSRDWFIAHRGRYDAHVAGPVRAFCDALSAELERRAGGPVTAKFYRLNRDLRFAKDKTPYNTHVHLSFTAPDVPFAWMVGLEPGQLTLGFGAFAFPPALLSRWRAAVDGPAGSELAERLDAMRAKGLRISAPELKRTPAPFDADHPNAQLLRHKSLAVWNDSLGVDAAFGADAPQRLAGEMTAFEPLRAWLIAHI